jgi:uncharacterized protein HemY
MNSRDVAKNILQVVKKEGDWSKAERMAQQWAKREDEHLTNIQDSVLLAMVQISRKAYEKGNKSWEKAFDPWIRGNL